MISTANGSLEIQLNGKKLRINDSPPTTTLLEYLRQHGYVGTKEGCGDGDCGACTVVVVGQGADGKAHYQAMNSCLIPLGSLAGREVITVEGIAKMNTTLESLASQFVANQVLQGSALVGRQVMAEGNSLTLTSSGAAGGFELEAGASQVNVQVFDVSGVLVEEIELGNLDAGFHRFVWDGLSTQGVPQAQGQYSFRIQAQAGDNSVNATAYALGTVLSVALEQDGMDLEVSGLGMRGMDQVKQIF